MKINLSIDAHEPCDLEEAVAVLKYLDFYLALKRIQSLLFQGVEIELKRFNSVLDEYAITLEELK